MKAGQGLRFLLGAVGGWGATTAPSVHLQDFAPNNVEGKGKVEDGGGKKNEHRGGAESEDIILSRFPRRAMRGRSRERRGTMQTKGQKSKGRRLGRRPSRGIRPGIRPSYGKTTGIRPSNGRRPRHTTKAGNDDPDPQNEM
ncbi:hypothetical protein GWK47_046568 [Chionoecetes opilio]|uniref:Uncharacterized protein n=1 Tax=Chionoecetes opilio TaxID=41210 RepID=A0A8J4YDT7_CHIOP|nr:hypothetical protein GWK47_046568 [Chionoecetes opilio]